MSPRWNWDSPTPLAASECALPPRTKGGGAHSPAAEGVGESQFQRLEKRLALCLLCAPDRETSSQHKMSAEVEFLEEIQTEVLRVFLLAIHRHLY
jgi:hypothetical protein